MPNFDIVKRSEVDKTFRVAKVMSDFDIRSEDVIERFTAEFEYPEEWQIGLIVGNSGTGKSVIARELYGDSVIFSHEYKRKSVLDDMPEDASVDDIVKMFYSVGFGSVPSWFKPYHVLSNGEKMRVDVARSLLENDFVVFDEFTSVVDRNVAKTLCTAIEKTLKKTKSKKFVAVSCHKDIVEYLQPDWVFDTDTMSCFFPSARDLSEFSRSKNAGEKSGESLKNIII